MRLLVGFFSFFIIFTTEMTTMIRFDRSTASFIGQVNQAWRLLILLVMGIAAAHTAMADMVMEGTRVVYPEGRREVTFKINNSSTERAALVQMWIDDGVNTSAPEDVVTPFNVTPPVAKVNTGASQVVRINFTGEPLPTDRESLFWFNMLEVPPKSNAENKLTFALRTLSLIHI